MITTKKIHISAVHWKQIQILGATMILLGIGIHLLPFEYSLASLTLVTAFIVILLVFGLQILFSGYVGREFQKIVQSLQAEEVHFHVLKMAIDFSYKDKKFFILYHSVIMPYTFWVGTIQGWNAIDGVPPEHFQIWTPIFWPAPLDKNPYDVARKLQRRFVQPVPPDDPFSKDIKDYRSPVFDEISSLCYVGIAKQRETPVLVALLRGDAPINDLVQTVNELDTIEDSMEGGSS